MYALSSLIVGLSFWAVLVWGAYRIYRAAAKRIPALQRADERLGAVLAAVVTGQGRTGVRLTYLWALANSLRYRGSASAEPSFAEPVDIEQRRLRDAA